MRRNISVVSWLVLCTTLFVSDAEAQYFFTPDLSLYSNDATTRWIAGFNPWEYARRGADFTAARYQSGRLGTTLVDIVYDYDFDLIASVEMRLQGVDRARALRAIFASVTAGAVNDTQRHQWLLQWLQQTVVHDHYLQPMYPLSDSEWPITIVTDPLVLLELGTMRCGQVARVAADIWSAYGYQTRIPQLAGHVIAEVYYDNSWHYFDADVFSGSEVIMIGGRIPSVEELAQNPPLIDRLAGFVELGPDGLPAFWNTPEPYGNVPMAPYPSYFYFSQRATGDPERTTVWYYVKGVGTPTNNRLYGWDYYETVRTNIPFLDIPLRHIPGAPEIVEIERQIQPGACDYLIDWTDVPDLDNDLLGYLVYSSTVTRGWSYNKFLGALTPRRYASSRSGWRPEMYPKLTREPPGQRMTITNSISSEMSLSLAVGDVVYVSIMPFDRYGDGVGRLVYGVSSEVTLSCP